MTELLYFKDCYLKEFTARVIQSRENSVLLDRTAFYPEGGGQPTDTGYLYWNGEKARVLKVIKKDGIWHHLDREIPEGVEVRGEIDWVRRYNHMRYHTAQHLLSYVVLKLYGASTTGNQIHENRARIDFNLERVDQGMIPEIEEEVNRRIKKNLPVRIEFMPRDEALKRIDPRRANLSLLPKSVKELRIILIDDIDMVPCGGTHVRSTGELGFFRITKFESRGKNNKRIEFTLEEKSEGK